MYGLPLLLHLINNKNTSVDAQQFNSLPIILTQEQVEKYGLIKHSKSDKSKNIDIFLTFSPSYIKSHSFYYHKNKNQWEIKG